MRDRLLRSASRCASLKPPSVAQIVGNAPPCYYDFATRQLKIVARTNGIAASFNSGLALSADERVAYFVQVDHWGTSIYLAEGLAW